LTEGTHAKVINRSTLFWVGSKLKLKERE